MNVNSKLSLRRNFRLTLQRKMPYGPHVRLMKNIAARSIEEARDIAKRNWPGYPIAKIEKLTTVTYV